MKDYGTFDILGPIMIGPSSSHTAGAARLAKISAEIAGGGFYEVEFLLHGSFAMTYKGHGTDKALVAGILGMEPDDENLRDSFEIAEEKRINTILKETDLGYQHPNTVKIVFRYEDKDDFYVMGSSVGGGNIIITDINGNKVELTGNKPTIFLRYADRKGIINEVSSIVSTNALNIATMNVTREKGIATLVCELDDPITNPVAEEIQKLQNISFIKFINPIVR